MSESKNSGAKSAPLFHTIVPSSVSTWRVLNNFGSFRGSNTSPQRACDKSAVPSTPLLKVKWT